MKLVVDCSFIMSSILPDEVQFGIDGLYTQIANKLYTVYVPAVFYLECNNVLISSLRKQRINQNDYDEYLSCLHLLPLNTDNFCSTVESLYTIGKIAAQHKLTTYDAAYLELALRIEASVATLDKALADCSRKTGLKVII